MESPLQTIERLQQQVRDLESQLAAAQQGVQPINSEALSTTQAVPTAVETLALSRECEKMPGGLGGFHHNYALEVLKRWGHPTPQGLDAKRQFASKDDVYRAMQDEIDSLNAALVAEMQATQPAAQGMDSPNEWEGIHTMPTCDDLIWLYCQDTNTIDGPIAPDPSLEQYGWTHWAYANAPSTAGIDAAQAKQGGV